MVAKYTIGAFEMSYELEKNIPSELVAISEKKILYSIAISLKRIADALGQPDNSHNDEMMDIMFNKS